MQEPARASSASPLLSSARCVPVGVPVRKVKGNSAPVMQQPPPTAVEPPPPAATLPRQWETMDEEAQGLLLMSLAHSPHAYLQKLRSGQKPVVPLEAMDAEHMQALVSAHMGLSAAPSSSSTAPGSLSWNQLSALDRSLFLAAFRSNPLGYTDSARARRWPPIPPEDMDQREVHMLVKHILEVNTPPLTQAQITKKQQQQQQQRQTRASPRHCPSWSSLDSSERAELLSLFLEWPVPYLAKVRAGLRPLIPAEELSEQQLRELYPTMIQQALKGTHEGEKKEEQQEEDATTAVQAARGAR